MVLLLAYMKPRMFGVLAETERMERVRGKLFKKEIVRFGKYKDPLWGEFEMNLDEAWAEKVVANWKNSIPGRVPVPAMHTDDPEQNRGEVVDYEITRRGLDAYIDIRTDETAESIENELIWDVSISFVDDWIDNKGKSHGPAILHVALVNNPYLDKMSEFEALSRTMGDLFGGISSLAKSQGTNAIMLSRGTNFSNKEKEDSMERETLTNDRDFPVSVDYTGEDGETTTVVLQPGDTVDVLSTEAETVKTSIADAEKPAEENGEGEENGEAGAGEAGNGENGSGEENGESGEAGGENGEGEAQETDAEKLSRLEAENAKLNAEKQEAEAEKQFNKAVADGKVVPAQKEAFMALSKAQGSVNLSADKKKSIPELLADFVNSAPKAVDFSEKGKQNSKQERQDSGDEPQAPKYEDLSDEQRAGLKALGVTKERFEKVSLSNPNAFRDLIKKDEE